MTYSNSRPDTIKTPDKAPQQNDHITAWPSVFDMLVNAALFWMARFARQRGPKTRRMLNLVLALLLALHGGTHEEKMAFFKRLVAQHSERQQRIHARYRVWRQRKCWMWGGGFCAGALTELPDVFSGARDGLSFDALTPD